MSTATVEPERVRTLNDADVDPDGRYVMYWMQAAQRAEQNPALEHAIQRANAHDVPIVVCAIVIPDYPDASHRQFAFMLGGLGHALRAVRRRGARVTLRVGDPVEIVTELSSGAVEVVADRGYLRHQLDWYDRLSSALAVKLTQVEGEVVVPIDVVSDTAEYAARTIRPKINDERDRFLVDLATTPIADRTTPQGTTSDIDLDRLDDSASIDRLISDLGLANGPQPVDSFTPGTAAARSALDALLNRIGAYDESRNRFTDPDSSSRLSPYLHFGQISPVAIARAAAERAGSGVDDFLDELVVRRELAINFVARTPDYDSYTALPDWARSSLDEHRDDARDHVYTATELEHGDTHDDVWNAVMHTIRSTGWVHNQLRMYWGKQIVRWTNTPEHAHRTLLDLNNRYFLDGRDPNSFANVGWCFGLHDQGFQERSVSGKLRPFTTAALERKDDLKAWVADHSPPD